MRRLFASMAFAFAACAVPEANEADHPITTHIAALWAARSHP